MVILLLSIRRRSGALQSSSNLMLKLQLLFMTVRSFTVSYPLLMMLSLSSQIGIMVGSSPHMITASTSALLFFFSVSDLVLGSSPGSSYRIIILLNLLLDVAVLQGSLRQLMGSLPCSLLYHICVRISWLLFWAVVVLSANHLLLCSPYVLHHLVFYVIKFIH